MASQTQAQAEQTPRRWTLAARIYVGLLCVYGLGILTYGVAHWRSTDPGRFLVYLAFAALASGMKVKLPGVTGTMSVSFLFILLGIAECSLAETLAIGVTGILVQCLWHAKARPKPVQVMFNLASMTIAIAATYVVFQAGAGGRSPLDAAVLLALAAAVFFLTNTLSVAGVISLTEGKSLHRVWRECFFWSFPYYLVGASIAAVISALNPLVGWQVSVVVLPVIYLIYRSFRTYLTRLEEEKRHAQEMADLHLRTIEGLALAIDAKDSTTHDHLQRVRVYAVEIGKQLGLSEAELEALRAAAILHDIGKLAVPGYIISKPGRLTPEEFEKMKIHPVVGAEILERIRFPCPVVPIVRSHHERWDGSGYPDGLKGEEIPIGARILGAVDVLDALASDRQYRRALPLDEAMEILVQGAGQSFDPRVVEALRRLYADLERVAQAEAARQQPQQRVATEVKTGNNGSPAAGFESSALGPPGASPPRCADFLALIAAARHEVQCLHELTHDLGAHLSLAETLSVLAVRLRRILPYDAIVVYLCRNGKLAPEFVSGENAKFFNSLEIPMGQGVSGWVAENGRAIVNGNPSVEGGYLGDSRKFSTLGSALSVPLEGVNNLLGVLTVYRTEREAFTKEDLRILLAVSSRLALSVENALSYSHAAASVTTDHLTGLPNARSLFVHLDGELARCRRHSSTLGVLACDLDGLKSVNDRFGHLTGDKVLKAVAGALRASCREYDYVARMGGDEFILVLPTLEPEALTAATQRLSNVVLEAGWRVHGEVLLTLSFGEAFYPADGQDAEQLLAEADRRLYRAKQNRRHGGRVGATPSERESQGIPLL